MIKRYVFILFLISLSTTILLSQSLKEKLSKEVKVKKNFDGGDNLKAPVSNTSYKIPNYATGDPSVGESIGQTTNYDVWTNSIIRDQIVFYNGVPHFATMIRPWNSVSSRRMVAYTYKNGDAYTTIPVFSSTTNSGWPQIDVSLTGSATGTIGIVGHTPNKLAIYDGQGSFLVSTYAPNFEPSFQFLGDNIFLATSGNAGTGANNFQFYKTTDFGVSFSNYDSISTWSPSPIFYNTIGGYEVGMSKSPNEQNLVYFSTNAGNTLGTNGSSTAEVWNGYPKDSSDNAWIITSTNGGSSWNGRSIGYDGDISAVPSYHIPRLGVIFENFGQLDAVITNAGTVHVVSNGYGGILTADETDLSSFQYPLLYWNSVSNEWKSISDPAIDVIQEIGDYYPGNMLGQSYPGIAASEDGNVIYVTWTGPQMTAGEIDTSEYSFYWTDIYHAYSVDAGKTWNYLGTLSGANNKNISEEYAHPSQFLESLGNNKYRAHIVYLADLEPGVTTGTSIEGVVTVNPIIYQTFDIDAGAVGITDPNIINSFDLSQNYPNPFNPETSIKYSIAERSNVNLKVFDMLGREVTTLINSVKDAGSYEVNFNASNLSSGLYIYTLNAGSYISTKKMMLLK